MKIKNETRKPASRRAPLSKEALQQLTLMMTVFRAGMAQLDIVNKALTYQLRSQATEKRRTLSPEGRQRIADAVKKRWPPLRTQQNDRAAFRVEGGPQ
jgi:hypothetical protein